MILDQLKKLDTHLTRLKTSKGVCMHAVLCRGVEMIMGVNSTACSSFV